MIFNKTITAAYAMATNYVEYMNEHHEVSYDVLSHIGRIYAEVDPQHRGDVYLKFKSILLNEGVVIDNEDMILMDIE